MVENAGNDPDTSRKYGLLLNAAKIKILDKQYVRTTLKAKG
jgi:hypothetical protein